MLIGLLTIIGVACLLLLKKIQAKNSPSTATATSKAGNNKDNSFIVTEKLVSDNKVEFSIELNEQEIIKKAQEGTLWTERMNGGKFVADITGFIGRVNYSPNKEYYVSFVEEHYYNDKLENGYLALLKGDELLFKKKLQRPNDCQVSNDGIVICCDWLSSDVLQGKFLVFDKSGERLFAKKTTANLGTCAISDDSKIAIFNTWQSETEDSNQIFIVDLEHRKIRNRIETPASFNSAVIDSEHKLLKLTDHRAFVMEIDFEGNQINKEEYEKTILLNGSVFDKLCLYENKEPVEKNKDVNYLNLLIDALEDRDASYSFGKDKIYRRIGEFYEAKGDRLKTIENFEKAIQLNLKVGVKRKLDALKREA